MIVKTVAHIEDVAVLIYIYEFKWNLLRSQQSSNQLEKSNQ